MSAGYSLAPFIKARPWLHKLILPIAQVYGNATGYRKLGLRYDDLLEEEREEVKLALARLTPQESYDRVYRIRRAQQASYQHKLLAKEDWTTPETDVAYLRPLVKQIQAETAEKNALDNLSVIKKH